MFVHAGLEKDATSGWGDLTLEQQFEHMQARTPLARPEMLCGREHVMDTPQALIDSKTCVVSGRSVDF